MTQDNVTLERIKTLHPDLREEALEIYNKICETLTGKAICRFAYTLRTFSEQAALYAQGRTVFFDKNGKKLGKVTNAKAGQSMHNYGLACFDEKTRIFTNNGLKYFYELTESDQVLTFKNGNLEYQTPINYIEYEYNGNMISINSRSIDLLITPNHKMIVKKRKSNKWSNDWFEIEASELTYNYKIPTSGLTIHKNNFLPIIKTYNVPFTINNSEDWYEFMGYWLSEGSCCGSKNGIMKQHSGRYNITISQSKQANPIVWRKINNCLNRLGIKFNYYGHDFVFSNKGLWEYLINIGNSFSKYIPKEMFKADKIHLEKLYYAMIDGDGTYYKTGESYSSSSIKLSEDFMMLSLLLNKPVSMNPRLRNNNKLPHGEFQKSEKKINYESRTRIRNTHELRNGKGEKIINNINYNGYVYCVTTEAGALVVERNFKTCIAGNCDIVLIKDKDGNGTFETASWESQIDFDADGKADWKEIVDIFKSYGWSWGGDFRSFKDLPHFEKTFGNTTKQLIAKYNAKQFIPGTEYIKLK